MAEALLQKVFQVTLLLLHLSAALVRAALGFRVFVTGQGAGRFLHLALGPVHGAFVFVLPAARASSTHLFLLVPGMFISLLTRRRWNQTPAGNFATGNRGQTVVKGGQYQPAVAGATVSFTERLALKASTITRVALMAAVTAVAAQITIPLFPVPFTLQVLAVILSGLLLGVRHGALAQAVYVLVGAVGVPVFAGFKGGLGIVLGPTGGYLISYPIAAAVAGLAAYTVARASRRRALWTGFLWGCAGLTVIYALGATWLAVVSGLTPTQAVAAGIGRFVLFDLIKVVLAALVAVAAAPAIAPSRT